MSEWKSIDGALIFCVKFIVAVNNPNIYGQLI
jgi:hypothetical protein